MTFCFNYIVHYHRQTLQQSLQDSHHGFKKKLFSSLTLSNNPLTYFIDSMSHTRQSPSALAAKVEMLLKLAYLIGNRTPTLTYFVIPLSYLLSHSSSILPFPIFSLHCYFFLLFQVPVVLFKARHRAILMWLKRIVQVTQVQLAAGSAVQFFSHGALKHPLFMDSPSINNTI